MSAQNWLIVAIVGFSLAGICFVAAIFMFIKMNIPAIIGDLTGRTVAREIKAMRDANEASGDKRFRSSPMNLERGILTEKVDSFKENKSAMEIAHASKRLDKTSSEELAKKQGKRGWTVGFNKMEMNGNKTEKATEKLSSNATEVLITDATEVLSEATTVLGGTSVLDATTVLNGTTVLNATEELEQLEIKPVAFKIIKSVIMIHTDEVI